MSDKCRGEEIMRRSLSTKLGKMVTEVHFYSSLLYFKCFKREPVAFRIKFKPLNSYIYLTMKLL